MKRSFWLVSWGLLVSVVAGVLGACGSESESQCPESASEQHLALARSQDNAICMMLHHTSNECAYIGSNTLRVYAVNEDVCSSVGLAPTLPNAAPTLPNAAPTLPNAAPTLPNAAPTPIVVLAPASDFRVLHEATEEIVRAGTTLQLLAVEGYMPAHGHGLAAAPTIDKADPTLATLWFQMPGDWEITFEFALDGVSSTVSEAEVRIEDKVIFTIPVAD